MKHSDRDAIAEEIAKGIDRGIMEAYGCETVGDLARALLDEGLVICEHGKVGHSCLAPGGDGKVWREVYELE